MVGVGMKNIYSGIQPPVLVLGGPTHALPGITYDGHLLGGKTYIQHPEGGVCAFSVAE